jgi:hypothetical protein
VCLCVFAHISAIGSTFTSAACRVLFCGLV